MINKQSMIVVGMADMNSTRYPGNLTTIGLGSCVGIALYDPVTRVSGLAHCMLPDSRIIKNNINKAKFVDTAILQLVSDMMLLGAKKRNITAKIAGGAQMFALISNNESMKIGEQNVRSALRVLRSLGISITASDTGKNYGRTVEFYSQDGRLVVKTIGHGTLIL